MLFKARRVLIDSVHKHKAEQAAWWRTIALQTIASQAQAGRKRIMDELKVCRNLKRGKEIHAAAVESGNTSCIYVGSALISMYARCGSMGDAHRVFESLKNPDTASWNALIFGYADNGKGSTALDLFARLSCAPDSLTFVAALKACTSLALEHGESGKRECSERGRQIHSRIGCHMNLYVQNTLIVMYAKCGLMAGAREVFDGIRQPNVVSWNTLLSGYADNGESVTALDLFARMKSQGYVPDCLTFNAVLKACTGLAQSETAKGQCLARGKEIHSQIGCHCDMHVQNSLIDMYAKCGSMPDARDVFNGMKRRNIVSWNALLLGYAENGEGDTALDLFSRMGCRPDAITFVAALKACGSLAVDLNESQKAQCLARGRELHAQIGSHLDMHVQSTLIDMYAKCGSMRDARQVFDSIKSPDVISWTALILGYVVNGEGRHALNVFARMTCRPDNITFVAALKACSSLAQDQTECRAECLERARDIHSQIGRTSHAHVQSTLIDMYAKCGSMVEARQVFDGIKHPCLVSWNTLIMGYVQNGDGVTALDMFWMMRSQGCAPSCITFAAALKACSALGALETGIKIHSEIDTECDAILVTSLVDFYGRCGDTKNAQKVFDSHPEIRNFITWNSLMAGYSRLGDEKAVFRLFEGMQDAGFQPDGVTLLCILTACSHAGLVEKAAEFFEGMFTKYRIAPTVDHYTCMLDILGRSNKLDDAMHLLRSMPFWPTSVAWMTVLSACRKWKNVGLGRLAFRSLVTLDDRNAGPYVIMAPIFKSTAMSMSSSGG